MLTERTSISDRFTPAVSIGQRSDSQRLTTTNQSSEELSGAWPSATGPPAFTEATLPRFSAPPFRGSNQATVNDPDASVKSRVAVPLTGAGKPQVLCHRIVRQCQ